MDIKQTLWEEVLVKLEAVTNVAPASNEDKALVDEIIKLSDRVIEMEKIEKEFAEKEASRKAEYDFKREQLNAELKLKQKQLEEEIKDRREELKLKARQAKDDRISRIIGHALTLTEVVVPAAVVCWGSSINYHYETKGYLPSTNVGRLFTNSFLRMLK